MFICACSDFVLPTCNKMDVHRLKFLPLQPKSITCCAFNTSTDLPLLAVSRTDGSIELWVHTGVKKDFIYQYTIPGRDGWSVECLKWAGKRLFSSGLSGNINEWAPPTTFDPVQSADISGTSIWSMDINSDQSMLAVGCENGQVCLYDLSYNLLTPLRTLDRQDGRVLSLSFHPSLPLIAVGCSNSSIKILNTQSSHSTQLCITLSDKTEVLVWSVKFLNNDTIVSGTSQGKVDFWHSEFGTLKQSFSLHSADVLTLTSNAEQDVIFASGVDHKIIRFRKVQETGGAWVPSGDVRPHTHDVRSLDVSCNGILVSGGVDAELCFNKIDQFDKGRSIRYSPFTGWGSRFHIAHSANILLFQDDNSLKMWQLTPAKGEKGDGSFLSCSPDKDALMENGESEGDDKNDSPASSNLPLFLLEIKSKKRIISSGISPNKEIVSFSAFEQLYIYRILEGRVKCIASLPYTARNMSISNTHIALCDNEGKIKIASISKDIEFKELDVKGSHSKKTHLFCQVRYSPCGMYLLIMTSKYRMYIMDAMKNTLLFGLPRLDSLAPPLFTFNESNELLLFASSGRELYKYDLKGGGVLKSIGHIRQKRRNHCLLLGMSKGLYTFKGRPGVCLVYDGDSLSFVRYRDGEDERGEEDESSVGQKRSLEGSKELKCETKFFSNVVFSGFLECGQLVLVEKPWSERLSVLPPTIQIDRYGN